MKILCPVCKKHLQLNNRSYSCCNKHNFDLSRHGYLNLALNMSASGDNKTMIKARTDFLNSENYLPLKQTLLKLIKKFNPASLLDLACGDGYYTKDLEAIQKFGIDLSKNAITHAAKQDKNTLYIISSIFNLPFEDESFDLITTIFAPIAKNEIARVLKKEGYFILVTPMEKHLLQLKSAIYENTYLNKKSYETISNFKIIDSIELTYDFNADNKTINDLFKMTPYYFKTSKKDSDKLNQLPNLTITAAFKITVYKKI